MLTPEQLAKIVAVYRGVAGVPRIEYHDVAEPVVVHLAQPSEELRKTIYIPRVASTLSWVADANSIEQEVTDHGTKVYVMQREYRMTDWVTTDHELTDANTPEPVLHLYGHRTIYVFQVWVEDEGK